MKHAILDDPQAFVRQALRECVAAGTITRAQAFACRVSARFRPRAWKRACQTMAEEFLLTPEAKAVYAESTQEGVWSNLLKLFIEYLPTVIQLLLLIFAKGEQDD